MKKNRVMMGDSYKYSHPKQYPTNTIGMFDYAEARSGKVYPATLFVGLQYILLENFSTPIEQWEVDEAYMYSRAHGTYFEKEGWDYIVQELGGQLPVEIKAVAEGTVVPTGNVLFTSESTDKKVYWVASWLETVLMTAWYPSNVATRSYYVRKVLENCAEGTQENPFVAYQYHNFGARGSTNPEAAMLGGMAHLMAGFLGSDNFSAMRGIQEYYPVEDITTIMHSINATEHSSTTAWGREGEMDMIMNHLENNKGQPIIAAVMDSYDYFKAVEIVCAEDGEFQRKINSPDYPIFVMRPDSGDPAHVIHTTLDIMAREYVPYTTNIKGYKVFNKMRIIWGDGITEESIKEMLKILKNRGYSSENIAFGSGGWLMQQHDRDTQGWAVKCSSITVDEGSPIDTGNMPGEGEQAEWESFYVERDVFKDPVTAPNKKSKKGKMTLWYNKETEEYFTDRIQLPADENIINCLEIVYKNGKMIRIQSLDDVRSRN